MAFATGTATGLEDLFTKIVNFLTTDASLVAASQQWQVIRMRRDNLASLTTNLAIPASSLSRTPIQTCRYDSRSLNADNEQGYNYQGHYYSGATGTWTAGSYVRMTLKSAKAIKTVRLRASAYSVNAKWMFKNFRLQYSDDGTTWTTALTVTSTPNYSGGEFRDFTVPGTPGSHLYWQILQDSIQDATTQVAWSALLLLEADGTVANHFGSEVILKATGTGGTDNIYTGIRSEYDLSAGWSNLFFNGYTGYDANEVSWFRHPGALPGFESGASRVVPMVPCWESAMPYWFAASGRSFRMGLKVSTSYEGAYLGFILPWATPGQYPYPLAVGGSIAPSDVASGRSTQWRYSDTTNRHGVFVAPGVNKEGGISNVPYPEWSSLYLREPSGVWGHFQNRAAYTTSTTDDVVGPTFTAVAPWQVAVGPSRSVWPHCTYLPTNLTAGKRPWRDVLGGGYIFQPQILLGGYTINQVYGEFEGVYAVSGYNNGAENTSTIDGVAAVIFQNAFRNTVHEFWAMTLNP